jgi:hypothetical protein
MACYEFDVIRKIGQIDNASGSTVVYAPAGYIGTYYGSTSALDPSTNFIETGGVEYFQTGSYEPCFNGIGDDYMVYSDGRAFIITGDGTLVIDGIDYDD